jgi:predicted neutral ceramidase superfamily lipid hydrolase
MKKRLLLATLIIVCWSALVMYGINLVNINSPVLGLVLIYPAPFLIYYLVVFRNVNRG